VLAPSVSRGELHASGSLRSRWPDRFYVQFSSDSVTCRADRSTRRRRPISLMSEIQKTLVCNDSDAEKNDDMSNSPLTDISERTSGISRTAVSIAETLLGPTLTRTWA